MAHRFSPGAEPEQADAENDNFASGIAHDLRAPLINIKGCASELDCALNELLSLFRGVAANLGERDRARAAVLLEQEAPEALESISGSVSRMDRLIGAMLQLSRLGHRKLNPEPVQMDELVAAILKSLAHQIERCGATVVVGDLPELFCDRLALERILGNLLDNALKYLDPGRPGRLEIFAGEDENGIAIHVRDNGRGIAPEDQEQVFQMYRRSGPRNVRGEGMGLAGVKTLVRQMNGRVWCRSAPGVGSTFSISLPRES